MFVEILLNWCIIEIFKKFSVIWIHICVIISNLVLSIWARARGPAQARPEICDKWAGPQNIVGSAWAQ